MAQPYQYDGTTYSVDYPSPDNAADQARVQEQSMRHRVLTGSWLDDALWREATFFDDSLREAMPVPELSRNPALSITRQLATLYDETPRVTAEGTADISSLTPDALWALCARRHFFVEGINECLMRVDWQTTEADEQERETAGALTYRVLPPHLILTARPSDLNPDQPVYVEELVWDDMGGEKGEGCWTVEIWDITGDQPVYSIRRLDSQGAPEGVDEPQPWPSYLQDARGPFLPHVLYHKAIGHSLWSPYEGREVFWGTLTTASLWTFWLFGVRDGSFPQRYTVDLDVVGATARKTQQGQAVEGLVTNPMTVVRLQSKGDGSGLASQWQSAMDVHSTGQAIEQFMAGLAMHAGVSPSDVTIGSSSQSGYAIVVGREGERKARRRQEAPARRGDRLLLAKAARITNARTRSALPTEPTDYTIRYAAVAESPQERKARVEVVTQQLDAGLLSPVDAYMQLNPGTDEAEATRALIDIAQARALLAAASAPTGEE